MNPHHQGRTCTLESRRHVAATSARILVKLHGHPRDRGEAAGPQSHGQDDLNKMWPSNDQFAFARARAGWSAARSLPCRLRFRWHATAGQSLDRLGIEPQSCFRTTGSGEPQQAPDRSGIPSGNEQAALARNSHLALDSVPRGAVRRSTQGKALTDSFRMSMPFVLARFPRRRKST